MSKIELKVIFDDEKNPIQNILEFNEQIIEFLQGMIDYKSKESSMDFTDPKKALYHMGNLMLWNKLMRWYATISLSLSCGEQDELIELDVLLKEYAQRTIQKIEEKKTNTTN